MKLDVCLTPEEIPDDRGKDRCVVVIDILRASTTILHALENGARTIIPTCTVETAMELAQQFERDSILLCGEREGKKIPGFDLGNSPFEYTAEAVKGKTLIFSSTNGSRAMLAVHNTKQTLIASFNNLSVIVKQILTLGSDVLVVCAGKLDRFALEDAVCAGVLLKMISESSNDFQWNDGAIASAALAATYGFDLSAMLQSCSHGRYLTSIGMGDDLAVCAQVDSTAIIPILQEGQIIKLAAAS